MGAFSRFAQHPVYPDPRPIRRMHFQPLYDRHLPQALSNTVAYVYFSFYCLLYVPLGYLFTCYVPFKYRSFASAHTCDGRPVQSSLYIAVRRTLMDTGLHTLRIRIPRCPIIPLSASRHVICLSSAINIADLLAGDAVATKKASMMMKKRMHTSPLESVAGMISFAVGWMNNPWPYKSRFFSSPGDMDTYIFALVLS